MTPEVVTMAAPNWYPSNSYGRWASEVRRVLSDSGVVVNTLGGDPPNHHFTPTLVNILMGHASSFPYFGGMTELGTRIALTTWESTELHKEWVPILNDLAAILVPCHWNAEVFKSNGVTVPIHVVPLGNSPVFQWVERPERKPFRFLIIADRGWRKGFFDGMSAFSQAFGDRMDVELVMKARSLAGDNILLNLSNPNIRVINQDYSEAEMAALYADCDCLVFAAHGEGWGWPPREFAATGGIALATNYGGMADDLPQWGLPLDYTLSPAWPTDPEHRGLGVWPDVKIDALAEKMKEVCALPYQARIDLGRTFSENVRTLYCWEDYGKRVLEVLAEVMRV